MELITSPTPDAYRAAQIVTNARKLHCIHATPAELACVAADIRPLRPIAGVCHGARNGWEVLHLASLLPGCDVIGTDIAPTAERHGLVQLDFHDLPPTWVARYDFVYSNSLDHSHNPALALRQWVRSLHPSGRLYLSHCRLSTHAKNAADCFGATLDEYEALVAAACQHHRTVKLGDVHSAQGNLVRDVSVIIGRKSCS